MLTAQGADSLDISEPNRPYLEIDALVSEGVSDPPGERTGASPFMANSLVEDQWHHSLRPLPAQAACGLQAVKPVTRELSCQAQTCQLVPQSMACLRSRPPHPGPVHPLPLILHQDRPQIAESY